MTASTDFLPFATGSGANVESQAAWAADAAVPNGFSSGIASSSKFNKALRQGTFVAAAFATWIASKLSANVADDGVISNFTGQIDDAIGSAVAAKLTGTPTASTPPDGDNSTRIATTAFVARAGVGSTVQTWQDVTSGRTSGTTYYNTTTRPIMVTVTFPDVNSLIGIATVVVGGVTLVSGVEYDAGTSVGSYFSSFIVPPGTSYSVTASGSGGVIGTWCELR